MKNLKEIVDVLIDDIKMDEHFTGMCINITTISVKKVLEIDELKVLLDFIYKYKPEIVVGGYWWQPGLKYKRINYLIKYCKIENDGKKTK